MYLVPSLYIYLVALCTYNQIPIPILISIEQQNLNRPTYPGGSTKPPHRPRKSHRDRLKNSNATRSTPSIDLQPNHRPSSKHRKSKKKLKSNAPKPNMTLKRSRRLGTPSSSSHSLSADNSLTAPTPTTTQKTARHRNSQRKRRTNRHISPARPSIPSLSKKRLRSHSFSYSTNSISVHNTNSRLESRAYTKRPGYSSPSITHYSPTQTARTHCSHFDSPEITPPPQLLPPSALTLSAGSVATGTTTNRPSTPRSCKRRSFSLSQTGTPSKKPGDDSLNSYDIAQILQITDRMDAKEEDDIENSDMDDDVDDVNDIDIHYGTTDRNVIDEKASNSPFTTELKPPQS